MEANLSDRKTCRYDHKPIVTHIRSIANWNILRIVHLNNPT